MRALDSGSDSDRKRSRSRSRSPKRGRKLREGAKIEARYRLGAARKSPSSVVTISTQAAARSSTLARLAGTDEMGRPRLCGNQILGAPRHRRDVAYSLVDFQTGSTSAMTMASTRRASRRNSSRRWTQIPRTTGAPRRRSQKKETRWRQTLRAEGSGTRARSSASIALMIPMIFASTTETPRSA